MKHADVQQSKIYRLEIWAICLMALPLIVARAPKIFTEGRFWAEEGKKYFQYALQHDSGEAIFRYVQGYFALIPNLAAEFATLLPLRYAPYATTGAALIITLITIMLATHVYRTKNLIIPLWAAAIVLIAPGNAHDVWLSSVGTQYYTPIIAAMLLLFTPQTRGAKIGSLSVLAICAFNGVLSVILLPLFILKSYREKTPYRILQSLILSAGFIPILVAWHLGLGQWRDGFTINDAFIVLLGRYVLFPFFGIETAETIILQLSALRPFTILSITISLFAILIIAAVGYLLLRSRSTKAVLVFAAGVISVIPGILKPVGFPYQVGWPEFAPLFGERYVYTGAVLFALSLLMIIHESKHQASRLIAILILIWWTGIQSYGFLFSPYVVAFPNHLSPSDVVSFREGPNWPLEVMRYENGETNLLTIWPSFGHLPPIQIEMPPGYRAPE